MVERPLSQVIAFLGQTSIQGWARQPWHRSETLTSFSGQRYRPVYHNPWGAISGHPTALDYAIYGVFVFQGEDGGVSVPFYFDGYREVSIGSGGPFRKGYRLDPAVQQAVLDLLLAQPDTPA